MNRFTKKALPAAISLAFSGGMLASGASHAGDLYVGAGVGVGLYDLSNNYVSGLVERGFTDRGFTFNDSGSVVDASTATSGTAWNAYVGYRFTPHFGIEAAYLEGGSVNGKASGQVDGPEGFSGTGHVKTTGVGLWGVGTLPLTHSISVYGKLGAVRWHTEAKGDVTVGTAFPTTDNYTVNDRGYGFSVGIGGEWVVWRQLAVRAEWLHVDISGSNLDTLTAGANWRFKL